MNPLPLSTWLGLAAATLHIASYAAYFRFLRRGNVRPNPATWLIWSVLGLIGFTSFWRVSSDLATSLQYLASTLGCIGVFIYAMREGRRTPFGWLEWASLAAIPAALLAWWLLAGAALANVIANTVALVGFFPMWRRLWTNPSTEQPLNWWLWSAAYAITLVNVLLHHELGFVILFGPVQGVVGQGITALLCLRARAARAPVSGMGFRFADFARRVRANYRLMFGCEMPAPSPWRDRFQAWLGRAGVLPGRD